MQVRVGWAYVLGVILPGSSRVCVVRLLIPFVADNLCEVGRRRWDSTASLFTHLSHPATCLGRLWQMSLFSTPAWYGPNFWSTPRSSHQTSPKFHLFCPAGNMIPAPSFLCSCGTKDGVRNYSYQEMKVRFKLYPDSPGMLPSLTEKNFRRLLVKLSSLI